MTDSLPVPKFTPWRPWSERKRLECRARAGVYLLAVDVKTGSRVNLVDARIVYVGITCRELARLLRYLHYAVSGRGGPHSGGETIRRLIARPLKALSVSAWAPDIEHRPLRSAYIRYVERKILLDWACKHGKLPRCNRQ